ncbi:sulfatase-like hydrolase/transferase [Escherichia coli]
MINSYDNSVTYVDHFISSVIDQVRDKKAIVFYAADHGESINEREHLHGTPRELAPPEQFRVPMMVWMSDKYLENPVNAQAFAQLKKAADMKVPRRHVKLYDTIMGCLGYTSPDGGINENNNWCHIPQTKEAAATSRGLLTFSPIKRHFAIKGLTRAYLRSKMRPAFGDWRTPGSALRSEQGVGGSILTDRFRKTSLRAGFLLRPEEDENLRGQGGWTRRSLIRRVSVACATAPHSLSDAAYPSYPT